MWNVLKPGFKNGAEKASGAPDDPAGWLDQRLSFFDAESFCPWVFASIKNFYFYR